MKNEEGRRCMRRNLRQTLVPVDRLAAKAHVGELREVGAATVSELGELPDKTTGVLQITPTNRGPE